MRGKIKTWDKCIICGKPYKSDGRRFINCPIHKTSPRSYYIFLYHNKNKYRISRNHDGHVLSSWREADRLLNAIRNEIDSGIFDIRDYLPKEKEKFKISKLLDKWIEFKESQDLSPSHLKEVKRYIIKYYQPVLGNLNARDIRTHHIEDFLAELPKHLSIKTKKNIMTMLRNLCYWLFRRETILRMPQFPVLSPPEPIIK